MELNPFFNGSALIAVDAKGRLSVPSFVRSVVERRSEAKSIIIGVQDGSPCLNCYDQSYQRVLYEDQQRLRLADEGAGIDRAAHLSRARRTFGYTEEAVYDTSGRMILPSMMRRKGQIDGLAFFLGVGGTFEIWNPKLALESGDPELVEICRDRLDEKGITL